MSLVLSVHRSVSCAAVLAGVLLAGCGVSTEYALLDGSRWVLLVSVLVSATFSDWASMRIPNSLSYTTLGCAGLLMSCVALSPIASQLSSLAPSDSLAGALLCGGLALIGWRSRAIGGGDVKLVTTLGALLGAGNALTSFLLAHLLAGVCVGGVMLMQRRGARRLALGDRAGRATVACPENLTFSSRIPMAGYYAGGVCFSLLAHHMN